MWFVWFSLCVLSAVLPRSRFAVFKYMYLSFSCLSPHLSPHLLSPLPLSFPWGVGGMLPTCPACEPPCGVSSPTTCLTVCFPLCVADEARSNKQGVLVHCLAGISRSVTVTVAYLMAQKSMCLNEAYDFVKKCKPNISPNFTFMGQLLDFEKALHHETACKCAAHRSADDDGIAASDSDSEKASPAFEVSPV